MFSPYQQNEIRFNETGSPNSAEPMTLGSPLSSPKSKGNVSQNYLPPYLFGEAATSPVGTMSWNTSKQYTSLSNSPFPVSPVSQLREQHIYHSPLSNAVLNTPPTGKSGGPPTQGLLYGSTSPAAVFDATSLDITPRTAGLNVKKNENTSGILTPSKSFSVNNSSFMSPAQIDPFYTQGESLKNSDQLDESWVTVFGFPSASAPYILQQFSQYGNIIDHKVSPAGNWMHIRYQSKLQAKKALSKNGKIFSGNIMIGVKPCIEMDLMNSTKENSSLQASFTASPSVGDVTTDTFEATKPNLKNIRPLTLAYQSPKTPQVTTPKSGSIVSKAIEYIWNR